MNLFNFEINKEACFAYWAQYMAGWGDNKKEAEQQYYLNIIEGLDSGGKESLDRLLKILNKSGQHGYLWLWNRYTGEPIRNNEEAKAWKRIREGLEEAFEKVWESEVPKLEEWQNTLSAVDIDDQTKEVVASTEDFFGASLDEPATVQLHFHGETNGTAGATKRGFSSLMLLALSNLDEDFTTKALDTAFHELAHLIYYQSDKKQLLTDALQKKLDEGHLSFLKHDKPLWRSKFEESIIYGIAGRNFSYFVRKTHPDLYMDMSDKEDLELGTREESTQLQTQSVAYRTRELTKEYLESGKEMDEEYIEKMAEAWDDFQNTASK